MPTYEEIYTAAKTKNIAKLDELVQAEVFLDEIKDGRCYYETAAHQLARQGEDAAVELLRARGASPCWIARGYVIAGNDVKVEEYRLKHAIDVDAIALSYALAGNHIKVEEYRVLHKASASSMAQGYAQAGNHTKVEEYRVEHKARCSSIAAGYAFAGNHLKVEEYRKMFETTDFIGDIVVAYALSGNDVKVSEYRAQNKNGGLGFLFAYAEAGNYAKVREFIAQSKVSVIAGYERSDGLDAMAAFVVHKYLTIGNDAKAKELCLQFNLGDDQIAEYYFATGCDSKLEKFAAQDRALAEKIACMYVDRGNDDKVKEYHIKYRVNAGVIAKAYASIGKKAKAAEYRHLSVVVTPVKTASKSVVVTNLDSLLAPTTPEQSAEKSPGSAVLPLLNAHSLLLQDNPSATLNDDVEQEVDVKKVATFFEQLATEKGNHLLGSAIAGPTATLSPAEQLVNVGLYQSCNDAGAKLTSSTKRGRYQDGLSHLLEGEEDDVTQVEKASRNSEYAAARHELGRVNGK